MPLETNCSRPTNKILQIYSGQNGKFKSHVDTPRSPFQFGSLVVCLPVEHTGGQLRVGHKEEEMTFDWSNRREDQHAANIRWAAFYSDCQHEVLEVTSGHRLTLTYNLYAVQGAGRLTGVSRTLNPANLPLFQVMKNIPFQRLFNGKSKANYFGMKHAPFTKLRVHRWHVGVLVLACIRVQQRDRDTAPRNPQGPRLCAMGVF